MTDVAKSSDKLEGLVLRKTPFSETSLILACLTRTLGQQHFLLRGARKTGKRTFPEADLFRQIEIVYRPSRSSDLHTARSVTCIQPFDAIARRPDHFRTAGWLCRFALRNTVAEEPAPQFYEATLSAFRRLAEPTASCTAIVLGVCFVALEEHGLLPDAAGHEHIRRGMDELRRYALLLAPEPPAYPAQAWDDLKAWMHRYLHRVGLHVPEGWQQLP